MNRGAVTRDGGGIESLIAAVMAYEGSSGMERRMEMDALTAVG